MIKVVIFNWNAFERIGGEQYVNIFHDMAVRECVVIEAGFTLYHDNDQQVSYVELQDELEVVEFKLRFF
jgi:hypothetical protein